MINNYNFINHPLLDKDDEPPPLPPPRAESLTRSVAITDSSLDKFHADGISIFVTPLVVSSQVRRRIGAQIIMFSIYAGELGGPPDKPLPSEPPTYTEPCTSPPFTSSTSVTDVIEEQSVPLLAEVNSDDSSEGRSSPINSCNT